MIALSKEEQGQCGESIGTEKSRVLVSGGIRIISRVPFLKQKIDSMTMIE